ncbi:MAG: polyprenyl synthetase family protein [Treponema sp.]|nr:polyprenyl synthetase family protein [Treponema sp.]
MFFTALPELKTELSHVASDMEALLPSDWKTGTVGEIIDDVMNSRGKGVRPSLLLLMAKLGPNYLQNQQRLFRLASLAEFIHMASLIHDDIVDDSVLRRGNPTIQAKYGKDMAVYAGDLILSQTLSVILRDNLHDSGLLLAQTIQDMCKGEISQAACRYKYTVTQEEYYQNIFGKTASMFVSVCKIGGMESGCSPEIVKLMGNIGLHLGYLFQIRDDLLDFSLQDMGDAKSMRLDFQEGILTLPVIFTLEDAQCKEPMKELIEKAHSGILSDDDLYNLDHLIMKAQGFEKTVKKAEEHRAQILSMLEQLPQTEKKAIRLISNLLSKLALPKPPKN